MLKSKASPFIRLRVCRRPCLKGGGLLLLAGALGACIDTRGAATESSNSSTSSIAIGVAESGDAADIGLQQVWRFYASEGLTARGPDGRARPKIAESWAVSDDGLSWRLTLRSNVAFHDGKPFDAEAARTTLEATLSRPGIIALYPGLLDIVQVRTEGRRLLVINLRRPSAFLLDDLDLPLVEQRPDKTTNGTGPYYPVSVTNTEVRVRAHRAYYLGEPAISEVTFRAYPTLRQAWASLLRGEIQAVWNVGGDALEFLTDETVETFTFPRQYAYVMAFNSQKAQLREAAVRRAINIAVDRSAIIRTVLKGLGRPAHSPVWPEHWASDRSISGYSYNPTLAKATLRSQAARGASTTRRIVFTCLVPEGHAIFERLALVLQRQLYDVGIDLQLESVALPDLDGRLRTGRFDAVLLDLVSGPSLSRVYQFWRSPGELKGLNVFGYRNPDADRWLDALRYAADEASTRAATSQLQHVMFEDPPALFLAWSDRSRAISRRIILPESSGRDPFQALWQWRIIDESPLASLEHQ